jgi:dynein heavy chain
LHQGIEQETSEARKIEEECAAHEMEAQAIASRLGEIKSSAQMELDVALPALEGAMKALKSLRKSDLCEIKAYSCPPRLCILTLEAVCILFELKPQKRPDPYNPGRNANDYYSVAKRDLLCDPTGFMRRLFEYDKDNIPERVIQRLQPYLENEDFVPDKVRFVSTACHALCLWVRAMVEYHHVSQRIDPQRVELREGEQQLQAWVLKIQKAKESLKNVQSAIANLERSLEIRGAFKLPDVLTC